MKTTQTARRNRTPAQFEIEDLLTIGWVTITDSGEENIYFTLSDGSRGFIKIDAGRAVLEGK